MSDQPELVKKEAMRDVLYAKVSNDLYRRVYKVSADTGFSMSEIIRLCVEFALPSVNESLIRIRKGVHGK